MGIEEGDEVEFFPLNNKSFMFAKKQDVANLVMQSGNAGNAAGNEGIDNKELAVLKKLDTLRYNQRSASNVDKILDDDEKKVLEELLGKGMVSVRYDREKGEKLYGISKQIYDRFLMRKKVVQETRQEPKSFTRSFQTQGSESQTKRLATSLEGDKSRELEEQGYIVVNSEAEAGNLSLALEDSIRHGLVIGTRSFNKKFYIVTRLFFNKNSAAILKVLENGSKSVDEIASEINVPEDAVRAVLYLLAESGDVSERKRDFFSVA